MRKFLTGILTCCCTIVLQGQKVTKVYDGDTFKLSTGECIRLSQVDCPEKGQSYGQQAKNYTEVYVLGKQVAVVREGKDKYGRTIAEIFIRGSWLNKLLVVNGYAWVYRKYGSNELYIEELKAKNNKRGLWSTYHEPPFLYRKNKSRQW